MKKYWVMKTFKEWWEYFQDESIIGIDEEGVDMNYLKMKAIDIKNMMNDKQYNFGEFQNRCFQQFCKWMQIDDFVIIGVGKTTDFNIAGIVRINSNYYFEDDDQARHRRGIEVLKIIHPEKSMKRFSRTPRLERIDEADFHESIISLI